jgi:hypothetical protein
MIDACSSRDLLPLTLDRFRWASLQLQSLTELKTDAEILLRLGRVPPSLQQLYVEIYQVMIANHGPVSQTIARNAFNLLLGAKDDFTLLMFLAFITPDKSQPILCRSCSIYVAI